MTQSPIDTIKEKLLDYAIYVNQMRANVALDGFKAVQRRIYYVAYKMAKDKFIKTATIAGNVIAYYHPHGEASVNDAIVTMVRNGWLIGKGNWGSKCTLEEIKPAAPRYTEVKFNDKLNWTMEYIKFAEYTLSDIDYEEPLLLPTPVPIGLIGDLVDYPQPQQGIGVGIRNVTPMFRLQDLVKLLESIINKQPVEVVKPFLGTYADVYLGDYETILQTGSGKVKVRPQYTLEKKALHIYHLTKNLLNVIAPWKDKLLVKDLSKEDKTHVIVEPRPRIRIDFEDVAEKIINKMIDTVSFSTFVAVPDKDKTFKVYSLGILPWLKVQFHYYIECRTRTLQHRIDQLTNQLIDLELIKQVRPYLTDFLKQHSKPDVDKFLAYLPDSFDKDQVKQIINKYSISKLLTIDTDTTKLKESINELEKKKETVVQDSLNELKQVSGL